MRILLTSPTYPPFNSGLGNAVAQQAAFLAAAGHQVVVATGGAERGTREEFGVRVETFVLRGADSWLQPIRGDVAGYIDFLKSNEWDVTLFNAWQNWATDIALIHLSDLPGRKFVYSHCISTNVFFRHQPFRSLARYLAWRPYWWRLPGVMRQLDGLIFLADCGCDSRFDDLQLAKCAAVPFLVVPNALSHAAAQALAAAASPQHARDRLIAVGSYQWQKGFDFVIRAYAASGALNKIPLHLFGQEYSAYGEKLRRSAMCMGVDSAYLVLHEGVSGERLQMEYRRAHLVLSGSHTECQPLALLDASACATPFVARATGCIDGMPGGVVINDWQGMARQIDALCHGQSRWLALSEAARSAAETRYHPDVVGRKLAKVLGSLA
jgi:glycosyltransferase involved in cell wall biosynthesis